MMDDLFGRAPYSNPTTSKEAAEAIEPHLDRLEAEVLDTFRLYKGHPDYPHGLCCHEVEAITGLLHTTASARIRGLVKKNRLRETEHRRQTPRNRGAAVWGLV
jgi:hypothetical protein